MSLLHIISRLSNPFCYKRREKAVHLGSTLLALLTRKVSFFFNTLVRFWCTYTTLKQLTRCCWETPRNLEQCENGKKVVLFFKAGGGLFWPPLFSEFPWWWVAHFNKQILAGIFLGKSLLMPASEKQLTVPAQSRILIKSSKRDTDQEYGSTERACPLASGNHSYSY